MKRLLLGLTLVSQLAMADFIVGPLTHRNELDTKTLSNIDMFTVKNPTNEVVTIEVSRADDSDLDFGLSKQLIVLQPQEQEDVHYRLRDSEKLAVGEHNGKLVFKEVAPSKEVMLKQLEGKEDGIELVQLKTQIHNIYWTRHQ